MRVKLGQEKVWFLTGTDEHGQKIQKAADEAKINVQDFVDQVVVQFKGLWKKLNVTENDFIRTTDKDRHWPVVQKIWQKLKTNGDIYKKKYQGLYCVGCESFITKKDLIEGKCKIHLKAPQAVEEENYFFKLSKSSKEIGEIIKKEKVKIIPTERKNEMLSFISQGLEDVSFSRPRQDLKWGIPVPDDDSQTIYVWADALVNYIAALGGLDSGKFNKYWPVDIHCLGKDILRFHATIWLGILLSLELPLPRNILVHGFITVGGQKMSKSLGNVIDPFELVEKYGADTVRYFLLREIPPTEDGDFTYDKFEQRYNSDLAGGLGNLIARVVTLAGKFKIQSAKIKITIQNSKLKKQIYNTQKRCGKALESFKFNDALMAIWDLISFCDKYVETERPWEASKKQKEVIGNLLFAISEIAKLLEPFLPETSEKILEQIETKRNKPLFPRI